MNAHHKEMTWKTIQQLHLITEQEYVYTVLNLSNEKTS